MNQTTTRLILTLGFGFLAVPLIALTLGFRPPVTDSRPLSPAPDLAIDRLLDEHLYGEASSFLSDRFAFRSAAVRTKARINETIWKDDTERVIRGSEGWLYLADSFEMPCAARSRPIDAVDAFGELAANVEQSGQRMLVTVAPAKGAIYPQFLSERALRMSTCADEARTQMIERWAELNSPAYLDLYGPLTDLSGTNFEPLYYPTDTHWTEVGAFLMVEGIIEQLQPGLWEQAEIHHIGLQTKTMDLTRILGHPRIAHVPDRQVVRPGVVTTAIPDEIINDRPALFSFQSSTTQGLLIEGHTLMVYDSFSVSVIDEMAKYFEDITFVHWDFIESPNFVDHFSRADTVILETAERFLASRGAELSGPIWNRAGDSAAG